MFPLIAGLVMAGLSGFSALASAETKRNQQRNQAAAMEQRAEQVRRQAAMNLSFGAVMGATLQPLAGLVREGIHNIIPRNREKPFPWEFAQHTNKTINLLTDHADEIEKNLLAANPNLDPAKTHNAALGAAALYDSWARRVSYINKSAIEDFYNSYTIDYQNGKWELVNRSDTELDQQAWHGSPHRFNKFSLKRIGSGEGAQVHGWGLYFAADRGVATEYRTRLGGTEYTYKGRRLLDIYNELEEKGEYDKLSVLEDFMTSHDIAQMDFSQFDPAAADWFRNKIHPHLKGEGRLYEVDVPDTYMLLDEQKALSEQSDYIKEALRKAEDSMPDDEAWANMAEYLNDAIHDGENITGKDLYRTLAALGTKDYERSQEVSSKGAKAASQFLDHFGIKGISYEGREDGRCFVIFNDKFVNIVDKLYQSKKISNLASIFADMPTLKLSSEGIVGEGLEIQGSGRDLLNSAKQWAKNHFNNYTKVNNVDNGWEIIISPKGIRETLAHGGDELIVRTIPFLDKIIRTGKYIKEGKEKGRLKSHIYVNKINLDGKDYVIGFVIREDANGKRFYDHEMTAIIDPDWDPRAGNSKLSADPILGSPNRGVVMNILREELGVNDGTGKIFFQNQKGGSQARAISGNATQILGHKVSDNARYEVWELEDVIPSHDPNNDFARRPDYPAKAQERPYHSDRGEQDKVRGNALNYQPDFVLNTDPTAGNGPPIITKDGIVLGGNSRTMTLGLVYGANAADRYKNALVERAAQFGIDADRLGEMKQPVLVRVLDDDLDIQTLMRKSREYNQTTTQRLQEDAEAVSRGGLFSQNTLAMIANGIDEFGNLAKFMDSVKGAKFVDELIEDGVILETERASYTTEGKLNKSGKGLINKALRGLAVSDYDVISGLPVSIANKIDIVVPSIIQLRSKGGEWDISTSLTEALRLVKSARIAGRDVASWLGQMDLVGNNELKKNPVIQALALTMERAKAKEIRARFEIFANKSMRDTGQGGLVSSANASPKDAFHMAFLKPVAIVDRNNYTNFDLVHNDTHAAIAWTKINRAATITTALDKINKKLQDTKLTIEQKEQLLKFRNELAPLYGHIGVYEPNLGDFFDIPKISEIPDPAVHIPEPEIARKKWPSDANGQDNSQVNGNVSANSHEIISSPRASVEFQGIDHAVVTFFETADYTSAPHELIHIVRRQLQSYAERDDADPRFQAIWLQASDFVGAKPGEKWTTEMEEKFASAFEGYLFEGRAPNVRLVPVFEEMKQYFLEIYSSADAAGLEINPAMRSVFDNMLAHPLEQSDLEFRRTLGEMQTRAWEDDFIDSPSNGSKSESDLRMESAERQGDVDTIRELEEESDTVLNEAVERVEEASPEISEKLKSETEGELKSAEQETLQAEYLSCLTGGE